MSHPFPRSILETLIGQEFCHTASLAARPSELGIDADPLPPAVKASVRAPVGRTAVKGGQR